MLRPSVLPKEDSSKDPTNTGSLTCEPDLELIGFK